MHAYKKIFYSINPLDNSVIGQFSIDNDEVINHKLQNAATAFQSWKNYSFETRATLFLKAADILRKNAERYGLKITQEMGKPLAQAVAEVQKCALVCEYYAKHAEAFLQKQDIPTDLEASYIVYQPLGAILQIMPWNFPFWQVFRFAAPALMAGNVTLLKHAPNVLGCSELVQEVFDLAGFPKGVFQLLFVEVAAVEKIMASPIIQGVALTGSNAAGASVGALAGKNIKNCVLELGGSDAFIVLEDANLEKAAQVAVHSRMHNSGQTCIAAKRFIVVEAVAEKFKNLVKAEIAKLKIGDPMQPDTNMSVMARRDLAENLQKQVQQSIDLGAISEIGGGHQVDTNYFYPMLLSNVQKGMPAYHEELFGPVAVLFTVKNQAEAVRLANDSPFGLAATIWSENKIVAQEIAAQLEVGSIAINRMMSSDPRIPFGGIKMSGIGRELGREGLLSFVNIKSVNF